MKLRIRSAVTKATIRVDAPDASSLFDLKTLIASKLSSSSAPIRPEAVRLSLNRADELVASSPGESLTILGLTSGDLLFCSLAFCSTPETIAPNSASPVETLAPLATAPAGAALTDPSSESLPKPHADVMDVKVESEPFLQEKVPSAPCFLRRIIEAEKGLGGGGGGGSWRSGGGGSAVGGGATGSVEAAGFGLGPKGGGGGRLLASRFGGGGSISKSGGDDLEGGVNGSSLKGVGRGMDLAPCSDVGSWGGDLTSHGGGRAHGMGDAGMSGADRILMDATAGDDGDFAASDVRDAASQRRLRDRSPAAHARSGSPPLTEGCPRKDVDAMLMDAGNGCLVASGRPVASSCPPAACANAPMAIAMPPPVASSWKRPGFVVFDKLEDLQDFSKDGKDVWLDEDVMQSTASRFANAVVGKFLGRRLSGVFLETELRRRWSSFGEFQFLLLRPDCFVCVFDSPSARDGVLMGGPWFLNGFMIGLDAWTPSFSPSSMKGLSSPIWIRLPDLPLLCWDTKNIARIASLLGTPLGVDSMTSKWGRLTYARVCVKVDLSKPLLAGVWVHSSFQDFYQPVEYEGMSTLCFQCGCVAHRADCCPSPPAPFVAVVSQPTRSDEVAAVASSGGNHLTAVSPGAAPNAATTPFQDLALLSDAACGASTVADDAVSAPVLASNQDDPVAPAQMPLRPRRGRANSRCENYLQGHRVSKALLAQELHGLGTVGPLPKKRRKVVGVQISSNGGDASPDV